jgi:type I restriction enzyme S subunit
MKVFWEHEIPLPPLAEQKRIAAILDAADALRTKRRESLAQLDALLQSTFLTLFGDPVENPIHPTKCVTEIVSRIIDYRGKSPEKTTEGIPLITAKIVKKKGVDEPTEFIAEKAYDTWMRRGIPSPQDVIITTEAPMGEVALVPDYKAAFAQRLLVLQPKREILEPIYLMWALTMPFVTRQMDQRATGSTVTGIRSKEFRKVAVSLPPLPLQQKFAAIVESVERQKAAQRAHLAELDALFAALQHRAFRGEL